MREILFRGKDVNSKEWRLGYYYTAVQGAVAIIGDGYDGYQVKSETVGQYTGLTDKNGAKIFDGDILEGDLEDRLDPGAKWRSIVVWGTFGWMCKGRQTLPMDAFDILEGEVIGNIYDNPELVEVIVNE